jgi:hypothetical protein
MSASCLDRTRTVLELSAGELEAATKHELPYWIVVKAVSGIITPTFGFRSAFLNEATRCSESLLSTLSVKSQFKTPINLMSNELASTPTRGREAKPRERRKQS